MAEFSPNAAQVSAITEEGANILVSAGAGSGKTTVLVERVLRLVMEERVSIDSLIIVTFTKAAAAHMKEKIYSRIREALQDPDLPEEKREHLKCQMMRVFSARICTIDSLCMDIVRENFQYVNIDPAFRIADEAEVNLLMQDVLKNLIEEHYAHPTEDYLNFVNYYTDKTDAKLEEILLTMYRFSQSHPDPEQWIEESVRTYLEAGEMMTGEDEGESAWVRALQDVIRIEEESLMGRARQGAAICDQNYGPASYQPNFDYVLEQLGKLEGQCFDGKAAVIRETLENWKSLSKAKGDEVSASLREKAKSLYSDIKKKLQELQEKYFYQDLESMYSDMEACSRIARTIADLTLEFTKKLAAEKRGRQIADFNDVAHFALQVLIRKNEDGSTEYTEAADSIARSTREIVVDEYQDTNRMQDALIEALSSERFGRPNVFMVGDVKQSIYGFRMACPDLFIEKYNAYADGSGTGKRIILGENYRSRSETVDFINLVFEKIMIPSVGGINYLDGNRMEAGADFPEAEDPEQVVPEVLFINGSGADGKIAESYEVARRIEELVENGYVKDENYVSEESSVPAAGDDGGDIPAGFRKVRYSDIAILTRRTNNPQLEKMLTDRHIPVRKSSSKGFFGSFEIRLALDLLRIIDNPYQDIPLAAVLLSPLTGLDANALAKIKIQYPEQPFCLYSACRRYCGEEGRETPPADPPGDETAKTLRRFFSQLRFWNEQSCCLGMVQFLEELLESSGLYEICSAMIYGESRRANLNYLKVLADHFRQTSYSGLFNFLRYLDAMQKADMDFGSSGGDGNEDAVTMMTIHKSKGLEFPVVILADGGKQIADMDRGAPVVLDDILGVGIELRDLESRIKRKTLVMSTIAAKKKTDMFAEEIRLLYVARSRAKEKLIITASSSISKEKRAAWDQVIDAAGEDAAAVSPVPDAGSILKDSSYMLLLADAMTSAGSAGRGKFSWTIKDLEEVEIDRAFELYDEAERRARIEAMIAEAGDSPAEAVGIYSYEYPYLSAARTDIKVTASQMERHETDRDSDDPSRKEFRPYKDGALTGAERGNAYHKLFELLDYGAAPEDQIEALVASGHLTAEMAASIKPEDIAAFLRSDIGTRMRQAYLNGTLKREQQFVMSAEINGNPGGLMQGIIDAFFIEPDPVTGTNHIVLVDYKTDRRKEEQYYKDTYRGQQEQYAKAIEAATGLPVSEMILYSTELSREIRL